MDRWYQHCCAKTVMGAAIRKYGKDKFAYFYINVPESDLDKLEQYFIKKYKTQAPFGYNVNDGGNSNKHYSEETKNKIRLKATGRKMPDSHKIKMSARMRGVPKTAKQKEAMSKAQKGRTFTSESLNKMSIAHKGRIPWNKGKKLPPLSEEHRKKISIGGHIARDKSTGGQIIFALDA